MLASITPLGERGRSNRWPTTVVAHLVGCVAPAVAQGALLGLLGARLPVPASLRIAAIAGVAVVAVALDFRGVRPAGVRRQVAESWLDQYRGWVYGGGYGAQLGVGWATIVTTWLVWAALATMLLAGSWRSGALFGLAFGLGRGLPVLATAGVVDGAGLRRLHRRLASWESPFRLASLIGASGVAVVLAALAAGVA